jgi:hypothetical protein
MGMHIVQKESGFFEHSKGEVFLDLHWPDGTVIEQHKYKNLLVYDAGVLAGRLFKNSLVPVAGRHNGINMLAIGTGAVGAILAPDAPKPGQRMLNTELFRKLVTAQYRTDPGGVAVAYPTHVVDFTTTFGEGEANGPLNEMGLISAYDVSTPTPGNPIVNGPDNYDPTIDVTNLDLLSNYLPFGCIVKPVGSILAITWRYTF